MHRLEDILESHSLFTGVSEPEMVQAKDLRTRLSFHKDIGLVYSERSDIRVIPLSAGLNKDAFQVRLLI